MAVGRIRLRAAEASLVGRSHLAQRGTCEDYVGHRTVRRSSVVLALADGAGSAPCGALGARIAVGGVLRASHSVNLTSAVESARGAIGREASAAGRSIGDYATTLLVARLIRRTRSVEVEVLHIGDGVIAALSGGDTVVISAPDRGEYANETAFLTAKSWKDSVRTTTTTIGGGDGVMLMSDGPMAALYDARTNAVAPACVEILAAGLRLPARRYDRALVEVLRQLRDTTLDDLSVACAVAVRD